jgi:hypothetical protein
MRLDWLVHGHFGVAAQIHRHASSPNLEAGYSVFTESLKFGSFVGNFFKQRKKIRRDKQFETGAKEHLLGPWFKLLEQKLIEAPQTLAEERLRQRIGRSFALGDNAGSLTQAGLDLSE